MSSGVEFDEDSLKYAPRPSVGSGFQQNQYVMQGQGGGSEPRMVQWLMKKGIVKSPKTAQVVLIGMVIVNIIITFAVITYFL